MPREIVSIKRETFIRSIVNVEDYDQCDRWFVDAIQEYCDENNAIAIFEIARNIAVSEEVVLSMARRLWDRGFVETVMVNLAIGISDDSTWSCGVTVNEPQKVCEALAKYNDNHSPLEILLIRNGIDGPVVIGHYNIHADYEEYDPD